MFNVQVDYDGREFITLITSKDSAHLDRLVSLVVARMSVPVEAWVDVKVHPGHDSQLWLSKGHWDLLSPIEQVMLAAFTEGFVLGAED